MGSVTFGSPMILLIESPISGAESQKKSVKPWTVVMSTPSSFFFSNDFATRSSCMARSTLRQACSVSTNCGGHQSFGMPVLAISASTSFSLPPQSMIFWPWARILSVTSISCLIWSCGGLATNWSK